MKYNAMVKSINGGVYPLFSSIKHTDELNGNSLIEFEIHQNKLNKRFINDINELWRVTFNNVDYQIVKLKQITQTKKFYWEVTAIPLFQEDLSKMRMVATYDGSFTGLNYFTLISDTIKRDYPNNPERWYNFVLRDPVSSSQFEGLGKGDDLLTIFQKGLDRYDLEFYVEGRTVYLAKMIGSDTQFQYRYKLNASNIVKEIDASNFFTYARGYGNLPEDYKDFENEAGLKRYYVSPLENIPGMTRREAPPIVDGRVKLSSTMDANLKKLVDDSLKISITASILDLRNQGYAYAQPKKGDRINLIDERIGLNTYIRAVKIVTEYNGHGKVRDIQITFGSPSVRERHQNKINGGIAMLTALLDGKIKLPYNILDDAVQLATSMLLNVDTQLEFTTRGILATNTYNPNLVVLLNSGGIGISKDGGATFGNAITGAGIVADYLTSGAIDTHNVRIEGTDGRFFITGDMLKAVSYSDPSRFVELSSEGLTITKGAFNLYGFDGRKYFFNGIMNNELMANLQLFSTTFDGMNMYNTGANTYNTVYVIRDKYRGRFLELRGVARLDLGSTNTTTSNLDIQITALGVSDIEIFKKRIPVTATYDPGDYSYNFELDLQQYFGVVPDYREFQFYIKIRLVTGNTDLKCQFRVNRGLWNG